MHSNGYSLKWVLFKLTGPVLSFLFPLAHREFQWSYHDEIRNVETNVDFCSCNRFRWRHTPIGRKILHASHYSTIDAMPEFLLTNFRRITAESREAKKV